MAGGLGSDTCTVDDAGDVVIENAGEGTDTVKSSISSVPGADADDYIVVYNATTGALY